MNSIKLVYFDGCPNYSVVRDLLLRSHVEFDEIDQGKLSPDDPYKGYSSPTVLFNSKIVIGGKLIGGGCTLKIPSDEEFNRILSSKEEHL